MSYYRTLTLNDDKNLQAYVIGFAIGDGNLSNPNKRAVHLRISCDNKYKRLIKRIALSLEKLLPENKVNLINKGKNCTDVSVYSNHLESFLGWHADEGPKYVQRVTIPEWIKNKRKYRINCLRGLLETDGSIYYDRGYKMVIFSTIISELANDVQDLFISLGFKPHLYRIDESNNKYHFKKQVKYQVRLSKNVSDFLKIVKVDKS
jgi:DNA-binding transcriptional regulator WhiA